ncbi:MAG: DUF1800 domain-containing protein [Planctomycetes bacterium]|nr:DUF1800 domain-containing protein [Planctomycetota bacterium]
MHYRRFFRFNFLTVLLFLYLFISAPLVRCSDLDQIDLEKAGHVLNRLAYGPSAVDLTRIQEIGLQAYIEEQLDPTGINESRNFRLFDKEDALFTEKIPVRETLLIMAGEYWHYRKGTSESNAEWAQIDGQKDRDWLRGRTGIGLGDGDDKTVLSDLRRINDDPETPENESQPGYLSVFLRQKFMLNTESLAAIDDLILRVDYDDGFKAYINGTEVARANLPAGIVAYDQIATRSHEAGTPEDFDISSYRSLLRVGENVLAIQVHNRSLTNGDLSMIPELISQKILPEPARRVIRGIDELQQLLHIRGVYSQRQLQTVLAEFWENHFTTDYDKLAEYFDGLQNSDATDALSDVQAQAEAAEVEYNEYQFFYENALGNFGDLLLSSATSPSMLVYLDNVLNIKGAANENYAREILELFAFGVDNRYNQEDIEQLAKCFTGWSICKVPAEQVQDFSSSALQPPTECEVQFEDTFLIDLGVGWRYFKGTEEPTPSPVGTPTKMWTAIEFDGSRWLRGTTGIGYGDGDDATILSDMRGNYLSIYMRRRFTLADPSQFENLVLEIAYDDGFVAYLNGDEIARTANMEGRGTPPAYDVDTNGNHEVTANPAFISLKPFRSILKPGENVLAIQVHNGTLNSSDLSILPRLIDRRILPGNIESGDQNGVWVFRFNPDQHETSRKVLFERSPYEIVIPAGRTGLTGLQDAMDVVQSMVSHPSTAEFICIKLIQKFVSDEITLASYKNRTAPVELQELLNDSIKAWYSTDPHGNIATIMRTILDPVNQSNIFWSQIAYRSKVKTPIEYVNSSLRALDADVSGEQLPQINTKMGMHLFTRDDPDGYSELGFDWIDTASMLERIDFVRELAENRDSKYTWDPFLVIGEDDMQTADQIVNFFNEVLYQNTLTIANKFLLLNYLTTDENGNHISLDGMNTQELQQHIQETVGLILSLPQWHFQ